MEFTSRFEIEQKIVFRPMQRHCQKNAIQANALYGTIVAVTFTKAKVFYDIVDEYWGILFDRVDSANVAPIEIKGLVEQPDGK